jgi:protein CpxP
MKLLQNSKFTGPALILLLALNTVLLVVLLTRHHGPPFPPGGPGPKDFLVHELKMDEKQINAFDVLIKKHREAVDPIQEAIHQERDSLVALLGSASPNQAGVQQLSDEIGVNQSKLEAVTFQHFTEVRKICTPEQQKKFDEIIREALRMMGPPPPKRGE